MNSASVSKPIIIDLNLGDQLTSVSCGHIVAELVKFIAYQRQQIPYTYPWLKQVINKRKLSEGKEPVVKETIPSERLFRVASAALENLDFILKSLLQEINGSTLPDEVCIGLGGTPLTCKEVYRLLLPMACHKPQCNSEQIATDQKLQRTVFRSLVTAEKLSQVFFNPLPPTNMYIFLKKKTIGSQDTVVSYDSFQTYSGCRIPKNSKIVVIDFRTKNCDTTCCNEIQIFGDVCTRQFEKGEDEITEYHDIESTDTATWYQSTYIMKGFKDCVVNGSSVTNSWSNS